MAFKTTAVVCGALAAFIAQDVAARTEPLGTTATPPGITVSPPKTIDMGGRRQNKNLLSSVLSDADGMTLYVFGSRFRRYDNITADRVAKVFEENEPCGGTDLAGVLTHAFDSYFARKAKGHARPETIVVLTDGEPDDQRAVIKAVLAASRRIERDEELAVSFVQVGRDADARRFLKLLDDELVSAGAPFDICDTVTLDEAEEMGLTDVLLSAIHD